MACGLQAFLKLCNAPAHGRALGCVGVDDGVIFVRGHAVLSISSCLLFCRSVASAPTWQAVTRIFVGAEAADLPVYVHTFSLDHRVRNQAFIA
jgi:hypothetical protein